MGAAAAYLAGLLTLPAALAGLYLGLRWWVALRRAQGTRVSPAFTATPLPPPPPAQEAVTITSISFRSLPGSRRAVRRRPD